MAEKKLEPAGKNPSDSQKTLFIPIDWEVDRELAMNESLPEVPPLDDDDDDHEFEDIADELDIIQETSEDSDKQIMHDLSLGCYSIETPVKKQQVVYTSRPSESLKKIENKRLTQNTDWGMGKLSLFTPVKTEKVEILNLRPKSTINLAHNETKKSENSESSSKFLKLNPTCEVPPQRSVVFRTPIQPGSLIKPRDPATTSKIFIKNEETKFEKVAVRGTTYVILKVLGKGGSSEVYQCFDCVNKTNRAIKCVSLNSPSCHSFLKEIDCLKRLQRFDRIIKLYDYEHLVNEKKLYVVMEIGSADLSQIVKDLSINFKAMPPSYLILFYWMEMLRAVQQIHEDGIIHSDLKPANFLLVGGKLKLIDFGIASSLANDNTSVIKNVSEGSSNYISPEALNCEYSVQPRSPNYGKPKYKISVKSDVWSLGCILYQLVYKRTPFQHITHLMQKLMTIANPAVVIEYPSEYKVPTKFLNTIKKCLIFNAKSRASVDELLAEYENFDV